MSQSAIPGWRIAGIATCVPPRSVDNMEYGASYGQEAVRKVVAMAGVQRRHVVDAGTTAADLCFEASRALLDRIGWEPSTVTALIMVTQTPDYTMPSSSCMVHKWLGLSPECAAFDVGLGCSGYPYGIYIAASMLRAGGHRRILMLHGETPSVAQSPDDHATTLLFGDMGSATALELLPEAPGGHFGLYSDGSGYAALIVRGGGFRDRRPTNPRDYFLYMDGAAVFNFTILRVPPLLMDTLKFAGLTTSDIDIYAFHQSNRFMMKHLMKKCGLREEQVPIVLDRFGNAGGGSVALALTQGAVPTGIARRAMMVGYGVGLSWSAAIVDLPAGVPLLHGLYTGTKERK